MAIHDPPRHEPAITVIIVHLVAGTRSYAEIRPDALPLLVIDTGGTEVQLSLPMGPVTPEDLRLSGDLLEAAAAFRTALIAHLD